MDKPRENNVRNMALALRSINSNRALQTSTLEVRLNTLAKGAWLLQLYIHTLIILLFLFLFPISNRVPQKTTSK